MGKERRLTFEIITDFRRLKQHNTGWGQQHKQHNRGKGTPLGLLWEMINTKLTYLPISPLWVCFTYHHEQQEQTVRRRCRDEDS